MAVSSSAEAPTFRKAHIEAMGAKPYSCDFQVHAPPDWNDGLGAKSVDDYLAEEYLPKVFASGRQVIGVPQHNPIAASGGAKKVRDIARRLRSDGRADVPIVFPGYELTSSDQLQIILLANPDESACQDLDTRVSEALQLGQPGRQWHESGLTLEVILKEVRVRFRDRLLSLVVATGHKGILEDGHAVTRNRELYKKAYELADGMILSGAFTDCHEKAQRLLLGKIPDYGTDPCGFVQSSDAGTFSDLSKESLSYLKLGSFTIEGVRQALLNCATFVRNDRFPEPNTVILRLSIKNTVFFDDLNLAFSPNLTALVGGRGTGKSCILEYMAHVCDYQRSSGYDRPNAQILVLRKDGSPEGTLLRSTELELHIRLGEKYYRFNRAATGSTTIHECADEKCEEGVQVTGAAPSSLINLRYFGQRELANIVRNPSFFALDPSQREGMNLFSFLKSDQLTSIGELERSAIAIADNIKKTSIDITSWARDLSDRRKLVAERERLLQDLEKIKRQASHPAFQLHRDFLELESQRAVLFTRLDELSDAQARLKEEAKKAARQIQDLSIRTNTGAEASLTTLKAAAEGTVSELVGSIDAATQTWRSQVGGLRQSTEYGLITEAITDHGAEYEAAKKETEAQNVNLALLDPLQKRILEIDVRIRTFSEIDEKIANAREARRKLMAELRKVRRAEGDVYATLANELTASTRNRVKMTVLRAGDVRLAITELQERAKDKRRFRSSDADELARVIREQASSSSSAEPATLWSELVDYLLNCFERRQDEALGRTPSSSELAEPPWLSSFGQKLRELIGTFDDEQVGAFLCQYVPDAAKVELRRKADGDDYIPIAQASVGQKATALFLILLAQTDGILVIDQPEDDLDNAFIAMDILPAINELKHEQQIIFATHNANMLVNAEAEKVVVLDTEPRLAALEGLPNIRGMIEHQGGIDQISLRDRVTAILEGGKDAFLARERKYRFR